MTIKSAKLITYDSKKGDIDVRNVIEVRLSSDAAFPIFISEKEIKLLQVLQDLYR